MMEGSSEATCGTGLATWPGERQGSLPSLPTPFRMGQRRDQQQQGAPVRAYLTGFVEVLVADEEVTIPASGPDGFGLEQEAGGSEDGSITHGMLYKYFGDDFTLSVSVTIVDGQVVEFSGVTIDEGEVEILDDSIDVEVTDPDDEDDEDY